MINYEDDNNLGFLDETRITFALCGLVSMTSFILVLISKDSLLLTIDSIIDYNTGVIWVIVDTFGFINDLLQAISIILGSNIARLIFLSCCYINLVCIKMSLLSNSKHINSSVT